MNGLRRINPDCVCGHEVDEHGRGEHRLISGCRSCTCDYWRENRGRVEHQPYCLRCGSPQPVGHPCGRDTK